MILVISGHITIEGEALGAARPLEEQLAFFRGLDVRWMEFWPPNAEGGISPKIRYEGKDLGKAKETLAKHGVGVACVAMPAAFFPEMVQGDLDDYLAAFRGAVDAASELGAKLVNSYCFHWAMGQDNTNIGPFVSMLRRVAPYAADKGVTVLLENEARDATGTVAGMLRIMEAVGSDAFGTTYDAANYYHGTEEAWPYAYNKLKPYIRYVHVKNARLHDPTVDREEDKGPWMPRLENQYLHYCPIPDGAVNIEGLLNQLKADNYTGFCAIEPKVPPDQMEKYYRIDVDYLRERGMG